MFIPENGHGIIIQTHERHQMKGTKGYRIVVIHKIGYTQSILMLEALISLYLVVEVFSQNNSFRKDRWCCPLEKLI